MAAPNDPPRRVSMSYILGLSNKPFKDPKPHPQPRARKRNGIGELLSTPGGVVEWAASDGRKGKLSGQGQSRSHGDKSNKATSGNGGDATKKKEDKKDTAKANDDNAAEDANPYGFTKEEDEKLLAYKAENKNGPWAACGEIVGKQGFQCKERFKELNSQGGGGETKQEQGAKADSNNAGKNGGGGSNQQQQQQEQRPLTKKEKKELARQNKEQGQTQHQGQHQKNNQKEQKSGGNADTSWDATTGGVKNDTGGEDNILGGMGMFGEDNADNNDFYGNISGNTGPDNGWAGFEGGGTSGGNDMSWDNKKGGQNGGTSDNGGNGGGGNNGDSWLNANNSGGSKKDTASNKNGDTWGGAGDAFGNSNGDGGFTQNAGIGDGWGAQTGGGDGSGGGDTNGWGDTSQKPASNNGGVADAWGPTVDGANDAKDNGWGADNDQSNNNGNDNGAGTGAAAWDMAAPGAKSAPKTASARHSHKSHSNKDRVNQPLELEVKPDKTFSADDLWVVARILQQDYQMVWNRVSWRFKDKTGRTVSPEVFEKKITGRIEGEKEKRRK